MGPRPHGLRNAPTQKGSDCDVDTTAMALPRAENAPSIPATAPGKLAMSVNPEEAAVLLMAPVAAFQSADTVRPDRRSFGGIRAIRR